MVADGVPRGGLIPLVNWTYDPDQPLISRPRIPGYLHFRVMGGNNTPDFRTISGFRKDDPVELSGLFLQALALRRRAGPVKLGLVALDGTDAEVARRSTGQ